MPPKLPNIDKENIREDQIRRALEKREQEGTSFRTLEKEFGVPKATLSDRAKGGLTRREAHAKEQKLSPADERALEK
jgi:hypothetical protein